MTPAWIREIVIWVAAIALLVSCLYPTYLTIELTTRIIGVLFGVWMLKQLLLLFRRLIRIAIDAWGN